MAYVGGKQSRRGFLKAGLACTALGAIASDAFRLNIIGSAAAQTAPDYKALVCVYLNGGNDYFSTCIPRDASNYTKLAQLRGSLIPAGANLPLAGVTANGYSVGLHPELTRFASLYSARRAAIVHGLGVLQQPTTRADLYSGRVRLPPAAGSHNDGNAMVHTLGLEGSTQGWGGRMMDYLAAANTSPLFSAVSVGLFNPFGSGRTVQQTQVNELGMARNVAGVGASTLFGSAEASAQLDAIMRTPSNNLYEQAAQSVLGRVRDSYSVADSAFRASASVRDFTGPDNASGRLNDLGFKLRTVARLIKEHARLGARRQVYYVDLLGFDTHSGQVDGHGRLLRKLDVALGYFDQVLADIGMRDQVTTFTTTEFGRALPQNGDGTDHGWGHSAFVMGGAVKGGAQYGSYPTLGLTTNDFQGLAGSTNLIPSLSIEQFGATLGRWFGVGDPQLDEIFPLLGRFNSRSIGFL